MLLQIRECRKRSLEGVADDLRRTAIESQVIDLTATTEEVVRNDFAEEEEEEEVDDLESTLDQGTPTNSSAMDEEIYQLISDDEAHDTPEATEVQETPETHDVEVGEDDEEYDESERVFARVKREYAHQDSEPEEDELEEDDDEVPSVRESVVSVQEGMNGSSVDPNLVAIKEEAVEYSLATWSTGFASKITDSSRRRS